LDRASVRLNFFGKVYDLRADDSEVDVREVVEYVQKRIDEQEAQNRDLPPHKLMVLAVLNMGKDYVLARNSLREREKKCASKVGQLVARIDSVMDSCR
jgi:cell division protein ZapA (FtsZ GTPase activity inhibitor)